MFEVLLVAIAVSISDFLIPTVCCHSICTEACIESNRIANRFKRENWIENSAESDTISTILLVI